ncbi:uncharacterized protein HD556DRAFT_1423476 [Suillus plorans]|uniref:ATPase AAA-type core domain-containing protein n=1 Tax=Suillus plorans TaxID=116603 RepID=A0A9P7DAR6_9AGAM|nr:uncharacterized protein HD556DRAFT_1423476 [Suillus plorans]KAG1785267.1 hypothetical protein HD556DRAFT_1423476 [Suillus plorans]
MFVPPRQTVRLPKLPLENFEAFFADRLSWVTGYDVEKHAWIKSEDYDESTYDEHAWSKLVKDQQTKDLIQSVLDTIECFYWSSEVGEGMNILLKGAPGTGKKTVAHAVCNRLKRPMLTIRTNDIPPLADVRPWAAKLASLAIKWKSVIVVERGDYFIALQERLNTMIREFKSSECICLWPSVLSPDQQALLGPFAATIEFPDLDQPARRHRWLLVFGRGDLAETISRGEHASVPTVRDPETQTFLREIEKISWYELDGLQIKNYLDTARSFPGRQNLTPQDMKEYLKAWNVPLSVRHKVSRFFALRDMPSNSGSD